MLKLQMARSAPLACTSIFSCQVHQRGQNATPYSAVATGAGTPDHIQGVHSALATDNCTVNKAATSPKILVMPSSGIDRWIPLWQFNLLVSAVPSSRFKALLTLLLSETLKQGLGTAQWVRVLNVITEDLGSVPSTHKVVRNSCYSSSRGSKVSRLQTHTCT